MGLASTKGAAFHHEPGHSAAAEPRTSGLVCNKHARGKEGSGRAGHVRIKGSKHTSSSGHWVSLSSRRRRPSSCEAAGSGQRCTPACETRRGRRARRLRGSRTDSSSGGRRHRAAPSLFGCWQLDPRWRIQVCPQRGSLCPARACAAAAVAAAASWVGRRRWAQASGAAWQVV